LQNDKIKIKNRDFNKSMKGEIMEKGEKLVIVGCSGAGGPAAMMSKKLMPDLDVTVIRKEKFFIVR
jgi:D-arabinose 1-dehydrogenase-like Zn-dependent alcohol dehydrogenase